MTTEFFILESRNWSPKNIVKYPNLISTVKRALKQNIMNLNFLIILVKLVFSDKTIS